MGGTYLLGFHLHLSSWWDYQRTVSSLMCKLTASFGTLPSNNAKFFSLFKNNESPLTWRSQLEVTDSSLGPNSVPSSKFYYRVFHKKVVQLGNKVKPGSLNRQTRYFMVGR